MICYVVVEVLDKNMADNLTVNQRKLNMSRIRSKDTVPEELVRKYLFSKGFRYRKHVKELPGCPDIVLPKYKTVVFVNGCFWHMHNCGRFRWPADRADYWKNKISTNVARDINNISALEKQGWRVLIVWECELKKKEIDNTMQRLVRMITGEK